MIVEWASRKLAPAAAAAVAILFVFAAGNASAVIINESNGHKLGVTLQRGATPPPASSPSHQAGSSWNGSLGYYGGPVFHSSTAYIVYWTPSGESIPTNSKNLLQRFMTDTAADSGKSTNLFGVLRQYYDNGGFTDYKQIFSSSSNVIVDTQPYPARDTTHCPDVSNSGSNPYPTCVTDSQLQTELARLVQANGLPTDGSSSSSTFTVSNPPIYIMVFPRTSMYATRTAASGHAARTTTSVATTAISPTRATTS